MRQKIIGAGIAAVLVSLAAIGAFASQDGVNLLGTPSGPSNIAALSSETPTETVTGTPPAADTPTETPTGTPPATDTATPTPTGTPPTTDTATSTPSATSTSVPPNSVPPNACGATTDTTTTATATATATSAPAASSTNNEDDQGENDAQGCDIKGIPDSNPVMHPEDGECEKHETVIKTTPSGNQVNVPCETQKQHQDNSNNHD